MLFQTGRDKRLFVGYATGRMELGRCCLQNRYRNPLPHAAAGALFKRKYETDVLKRAYEQIEDVRNFFRDAKSYFNESSHVQRNIKIESVKGLFDHTQTFFVHCNLVNEMMIAVEFAKEFGFHTVIVGGAESNKITDYLKENNIAVILNEMHNLPIMQDDDVDMYAKLPYQLQQAGVPYCINDFDQMNRGRI
jgi:hypothetical protein